MTGAAIGSVEDQLREGLRVYYTRYYRDTLGLPNWPRHVETRFGEADIEATRIPILERALGRPFRGLRILNVGCGTGGFNAAAELAGARTWGVDASPHAIEICELRRRAGGGGHYVEAVAEALPLRSGSYDLVHCLSTLEHVQDVAQVIREMVRVTRPGGAILLYAPNMWAMYENHYKIFWLPRFPRPLARLYLRMRGRPPGFIDTLNYLPARRCRRLLEASGTSVTTFALTSHRGTLTGWLGRLIAGYYWLFGISPAIQLLARKSARQAR
jgi:2-polyprenyl-3-methyl-5-hydroxy-6-metoxy-1,4-benzoquinol methylase